MWTDRYSARPHEQLTFDRRKIPLPAGDRTISTCANTVCSRSLNTLQEGRAQGSYRTRVCDVR